jgi:hypothetical protein
MALATAYAIALLVGPSVLFLGTIRGLGFALRVSVYALGTLAVMA